MMEGSSGLAAASWDAAVQQPHQQHLAQLHPLAHGGSSAPSSCASAAGARGGGLEVREMGVHEGALLMASLLQPLQLSSSPSLEPPTTARRERSSATQAANVPRATALRPGYGAAGREVPVIANHFPVTTKTGQAFAYVVHVQRTAVAAAACTAARRGSQTPRCGDQQQQQQQQQRLPPAVVRAVLSRLAVEGGWPSGWATDGEAALYMASMVMPRGSCQLSAQLPAGDVAGGGGCGAAAGAGDAVADAFTVHVIYQGAVDLAAAHRHGASTSTAERERGAAVAVAALRALDTILRHGAATREGAGAGGAAAAAGTARLLLPPRMRAHQEVHAALGGGAEGWLGASQLVRITQGGITLALDLASEACLAPTGLPSVVSAILAQADTGVAVCGSHHHLQQQQQQQREEQGEVGEAWDAAAAADEGDAAWPPGVAASLMLTARLAGVRVDVRLPSGVAGDGAACGRGGCMVVRGVSAASACHLPCAHHEVLPAGGVGGDEPPAHVPDDAGGVDAPQPPLGEGVAATVAERYRRLLGTPLARPELPCVDVGRGAHPVWVPLELCSVAPGQKLGHLSAQQAAAMEQLASHKPPEHKALIEAMLAATVGVVSDPGLRSFGLEVASGMVSVRARVLPPPCLAFGTPECVQPGAQGQWNVRRLRLVSPAHVASWAAVCLAPQEAVDVTGPSGVTTFLADAVQVMVSQGMAAPLPPVVYAQPAATVLAHLQQAAAMAVQHFGSPCQLLLVLAPAEARPAPQGLLQEVKLAGDCVLGIPTEVASLSEARVGASAAAPHGRLQFCRRLALRINAQLGGVNVRLAGELQAWVPLLGQRPFMLLGVATHASEADPDAVVAAVVATRDRTLGRYSTQLLPQPAPACAHDMAEGEAAGAMEGVRPVVGLVTAVQQLLLGFLHNNQGVRPEALLVYRVVRGWEEASSLAALANAELAQIKEACASLEADYAPAITVVLAAREHATRLFPADKENLERGGNVLPGTVTDRGICHPSAFDFYLASDASKMGTTRPSQYTVAVDEAGFSADSIQLLTYWLCHLCCTTTQSISLPAPAHYARLAARRGTLLADAIQTRGRGGDGGGRAPPGSVDGGGGEGADAALTAGDGRSESAGEGHEPALVHPRMCDVMFWL